MDAGADGVATVYKQIDYLAAQLTKLEAQMIDPQDYGRLQGTVDAMKDDITRLSEDVSALGEKLESILHLLNEVRGGWRLMAWIGGGLGTLIALFAWLKDHVKIS